MIGLLLWVVGCGNSKVDACSDTVATPGGLVPRECVHEVPNGGLITTDSSGVSTVSVNGKVVATYPPCPCGGLTIGDGRPPKSDAAVDAPSDATNSDLGSETLCRASGCFCAPPGESNCPIDCYRTYVEKGDAGLEFAACALGPPTPGATGPDGGPTCTYDNGAAPGKPSNIQGSCPTSGCPAGTVCVTEVGGVAGGGGAYCAQVPVECHGQPSCACMGVCACTGAFGLQPERCSDQGGALTCDNGIR
jgi:hypothetical protein